MAMLARQLLRAATLKQSTPALSLSAFVRPVSTEGPDRDLKNFPKPVQKVESDPVRLLFIPEEWFDFFYKKTGVTGPYCLGGGYLTYLLSKEVWVIDHDFPFVICFFSAIGIVKYKFGDQIGAFLKSKVDANEEELKGVKQKSIDSVQSGIASLKKEIWRVDGQKEIFTAKKDNILMQLEAEYRSRALDVYNQVKKRLDYQVQIEYIDRSIAHKNMVTWIIDNVKKSITPQQEKESLKKCFADLQALAAKA